MQILGKSKTVILISNTSYLLKRLFLIHKLKKCKKTCSLLLIGCTKLSKRTKYSEVKNFWSSFKSKFNKLKLVFLHQPRLQLRTNILASSWTSPQETGKHPNIQTSSTFFSFFRKCDHSKHTKDLFDWKGRRIVSNCLSWFCFGTWRERGGAGRGGALPWRLFIY